MATTLINGVNTARVDAGMSIHSLKAAAKSILNLDGTEKVFVNNTDQYPSDYIAKDGDVVEFIKPAGRKGIVSVTVGVNVSRLELDGKTIAEVRAATKFLHTEDKEAIVNGRAAAETYRLQPGDSVEFRKPAGTKGQVA